MILLSPTIINQSNQTIMKKKRIPAPLDEKNVTTDWIEELLPEEPMQTISHDWQTLRATEYIFYRACILWKAYYRWEGNEVYLHPLFANGQNVPLSAKSLIGYLRNELNYGEDLIVDVELLNGNSIRISFWWEMEE